MKRKILATCVLFAGFAATAGARVPGQVQALAPASGSFATKCNPTTVTYQFSPTQAIESYV